VRRSAPPVPDDTPTQPLRLFAALERWGVDDVAIGGIAAQAHGHPGTTRDVDVVVGPEPQNVQRLASALRELRARLLDAAAGRLRSGRLRPGAGLSLMTAAGRLDVWIDASGLSGAAPWPEIRARSLEARVSGTRIRVCGRDDLIRMKRASGRPRDLQDIAALAWTAEDGEPP
jgi:hypothetical protein